MGKSYHSGRTHLVGMVHSSFIVEQHPYCAFVAVAASVHEGNSPTLGTRAAGDPRQLNPGGNRTKYETTHQGRTLSQGFDGCKLECKQLREVSLHRMPPETVSPMAQWVAWRHTGSTTFTLAPALIRAATHLEFPHFAANVSAVHPLCIHSKTFDRQGN